MRVNKASQRRIQRAVSGRRITHMQGVKEERENKSSPVNKHFYVRILRG